MNNMFGQMDFGSIFGDEFAIELAAEKEKTKKTTSAKADSKKEKSSKDKSSTTKKKNKVMHVTLPCKVYGSSFKTTVVPTEGDSEIIDSTELLKRLQAIGIDEAVTLYRDLFIPEDNASVAYLVDKAAASLGNDTLLQFGENAVTFAYGEKKIAYTLSDFGDKDEDEITLADAVDKIVESFPCFKGAQFGYDVEAAVILPIFKTPLAEKATLTLPITVNNTGEEVVVGEEDAGGNTVKDVVNFLSSEYMYADLNVQLIDQGDGHFFISLRSGKALGELATELKKNKGAKTQKKEEKFPSSCTVFLCFNGYTEQLAPEKFDGKEKIKKQDIIEYFKPRFAVFSSAEKVSGINCFYDELQNRLSVDCAPGRRGAYSASATRRYNAAWDYEEREVYNNPSGADPMENAIFSNTELYSIMHDRNVVAFNRPIYCRGSYYESMVYANKSAAYIYTSTGGLNRLSSVTLKIPKVPRRILDAMVCYFRMKLPDEAICKIVYDHGTGMYSIMTPVSASTNKVSVSNARFSPLKTSTMEVVAIFHSHNTMPAFFSKTDNIAEMDQIGIFGVIGRLDTDVPEIKMRAIYEGGVKVIHPSLFFEEVIV